MSENDQILGNVGGEEATASGRVDNGEAPEPTDAPSIDDDVDMSSQQGDVDAVDSDMVDNGAAGSAQGPADPSVPPANGARRLTALPIELLRLIAADLDPIGYRGVRLSSPELRRHLDAPPPMSRGEYAQFQKRLEAHSSHKMKTLFCSFCGTFKKPTPSKTTFTDAQAVQDHSGRRNCIQCGIANGHYDKRDVVIKKKKLFVCGGCKQILPHDKEDRVVADVVMTKAYPYRDSGWGRGAEITIDSGGKRWCRPCRVTIGSLGASGAIKLKQVYMP